MPISAYAGRIEKRRSKVPRPERVTVAPPVTQRLSPAPSQTTEPQQQRNMAERYCEKRRLKRPQTATNAASYGTMVNNVRGIRQQNGTARANAKRLIPTQQKKVVVSHAAKVLVKRKPRYQMPLKETQCCSGERMGRKPAAAAVLYHGNEGRCHKQVRKIPARRSRHRVSSAA